MSCLLHVLFRSAIWPCLELECNLLHSTFQMPFSFDSRCEFAAAHLLFAVTLFGGCLSHAQFLEPCVVFTAFFETALPFRAAPVHLCNASRSFFLLTQTFQRHVLLVTVKRKLNDVGIVTRFGKECKERELTADAARHQVSGAGLSRASSICIAECRRIRKSSRRRRFCSTSSSTKGGSRRCPRATRAIRSRKRQCLCVASRIYLL